MNAIESRLFDHSDARAFLCAIADAPDDDTVRLALADWLDEQATASVSCRTCDGKALRHEPPDATWRAYLARDKLGREIRMFECPACHGTAFVPDTSNADRAELIRVQCELAKRVAHEDVFRPRRPYSAAIGALHNRESALLTANAERWRAGPKCERCGGNGTVYNETDESDYPCEACWCSGDLGGLRRRFSPAVPGTLAQLVAVTYHRGMKVVTVPRAADVWEQYEHIIPGAAPFAPDVRYHPTKWVKAVVTHHPDVVEVVVGDRKPEPWARRQQDPSQYVWYFGAARNPQTLPEPIFDALQDWDDVRDGQKIYNTEPAAVTALSRALPRWARSFPEVRA